MTPSKREGPFLDPYTLTILYPERNEAPRIAVGWRALCDLLSDGQEHPRSECVEVVSATGLRPRTAMNLVAAARNHGRIVGRREGRTARYRAVTRDP